LGAGSAPAQTTAGAIAERRLVSVLFADLVGFTTLSEHRDPEEVRDLLSRYFDRCRVLIERFGGTVEKFIGDAVMAVWGTPVAREDDAERAVRTGLALTQAVALLGEEVGMPGLRARAGVLTGSAAVEVGGEGEGMVLGDTVNTESRLQSIAEPGTVLVDDVTRRSSEAAIAYEDAGVHQVKGREQPVHAWAALRVVAGAGGARRTAGLEAPFVGRHQELRAIIEASDESAAGGRARHVSILGEAGSGKSRLVWEFFKYLDGIEEARYWHQGRSLSYGEGVGYWALAEMVRARAGIQDEDDPATVREKLGATVERFVPEERDRRLVEPRLAHLLRLEDRPDADRADLFSGWRLFFERLSDDEPVILAFEDVQWADSGLLDFIDYLLEWSADFPIFVLTLARPEFAERRPGWRYLMLGLLEGDAIATMLEGLAPGLPEELVTEIVRRSACFRTGASSFRRARAMPSKGKSRSWTCRKRSRRSSRRGSMVSRPWSDRCSRTPPCSGSRSRPWRRRRSAACPSPTFRACSTPSSPSRCWRATTTRARPSEDSTSSSRRCCARSRTARCRAARARRGT
jgi:class 3 adenylate cyclase